mmetsp:Transcript_15450/g.49606  ORF Transcript_15450/g.49606 Transcript_15450/m.49606 type:complete len:254 (+) Transcript_15450:283-1044(+)
MALPPPDAEAESSVATLTAPTTRTAAVMMAVPAHAAASNLSPSSCLMMAVKTTIEPRSIAATERGIMESEIIERTDETRSRKVGIDRRITIWQLGIASGLHFSCVSTGEAAGNQLEDTRRNDSAREDFLPDVPRQREKHAKRHEQRQVARRSERLQLAIGADRLYFHHGLDDHVADDSRENSHEKVELGHAVHRHGARPRTRRRPSRTDVGDTLSRFVFPQRTRVGAPPPRCAYLAGHPVHVRAGFVSHIAMM